MLETYADRLICFLSGNEGTLETKGIYLIVPKKVGSITYSLLPVFNIE